jgi:quercetin dioxygenase-like cupin family protein
MLRRKLAGPAFALLAAGGFVACSEDAPVAPTSMDHMTAPVAGVSLEPFTFRAPLDPFRIAQLPDFLIRSKAKTDIVIQQSVFPPGAGMWHTHPGPSFVYVIQGEIRLERVKGGECRKTPVRGPGSAYYEIADEVHRAIVVSAEPAVVVATRFNIPVGAPITVPAADPGC